MRSIQLRDFVLPLEKIATAPIALVMVPGMANNLGNLAARGLGISKISLS